MPLYLAVFIDVLGYSVLIPFLPFFGQQYRATPAQIGLLLSANALFGLISGPVWGSLSDRYGRKPFLLLSQLGTLVGFVMLVFARSLTMLFVSRIVDGLFGGQFPIARAIISDLSKPQDRSREMSNIGVAHVLSSLLGPGVGGLLARYGFQAPALLAAGLTLLTMVLTIMFVPESLPAAAATASDGPSTPARGMGRTRVLWHNAQARQLLVQWLFHTLSFSLFMACVSLFANLKLGMHAREVGLMLTLAGIVRVAIRFAVFVPLLNWLGDATTARLGLGIFVVVYALVGWATTQWQFGAALAMASFAASCTRGPLTALLSRTVLPTEQGLAMGASSALDNLAEVVGPIVGGAILGSQPAWVYGALASLLSLVAFGISLRTLGFALDGADQERAIASPNHGR